MTIDPLGLFIFSLIFREHLWFCFTHAVDVKLFFQESSLVVLIPLFSVVPSVSRCPAGLSSRSKKDECGASIPLGSD